MSQFLHYFPYAYDRCQASLSAQITEYKITTYLVKISFSELLSTRKTCLSLKGNVLSQVRIKEMLTRNKDWQNKTYPIQECNTFSNRSIRPNSSSPTTHSPTTRSPTNTRLNVRVNVRYSQLPLLRTPSGPRVSVLNNESP